jgi:hypothetical protein
MKSDSRQSAVGRLRGLGSRDGELVDGYREMASDQEHEAEALEWCEGLIGDANPRQDDI